MDWFDLVVHNPEKSTEDLALAGITESNLIFKDSEHYKEIPEVKSMFSNSDGTFNEEKYNKFYKNISKMYSDYVTRSQEYEAFNRDYDLDDMRNRNKLKGEVYLRKVANPTQYKQGLSGIFKTTEGQLSRREAMQNAEVRDWKTGVSLGYTPNDDDKRGLFDFLGLEPLVEAVWEEDGTHIDPISGQTVKHVKGDLKTDENGNYYYETLGDRDASGKNFLKVWDTLTVDGTFWNKFDPFDSDGVSKNIGGQIVKTAALVAPLLIPGVNTAYGYLMAGSLLSDALATFGKAGTEMLDSDYKNNSLWNKFNLYGAFMRRFDGSSSDENGYFEQGTNMLSSVASQLFQQRAIAQIPTLLKWNKAESKVIKEFIDSYGDKYLKQYGKSLSKALADGDITATNLLTEKKLLDSYNHAMKMGKRASDASKLYMVLTQSQGVYDTFKENGFDETTTALGLLGTAYGFNKLFNTSLGEVALSGLGLDELGSAVKPVTKKLADEMSESLKKLATETTTETTKNAKINVIRKYADNFVNKFKDVISNSSGLRADMLKESIEETSEELLQDAALVSAQSINWALDKLNLKEDTNTYDYFKTNPLERYLMSAVGGAMGSAVFTGIRKWESMINGNTAIAELPKEDLKNLIKVVSNNPTSEIRRIIENTNFGSKTLSAQLESAPDGSSYFKTASSYEDSQDSVIKKTILSIVDSIDSAINSEIGSVDKNNILNSALGRDLRARALAEQSYSVVQNIANDFNNIIADLVQAKAKIASVKDGESPSKTDLDLYNDAKNRYEQLINGERASEYVEKTAFLLNRGVSGAFKDNLDIYTFAMSRGKNYATMSPEEKAELDELYKTKTASELNKEDTAFSTFKFFQDKVLNDLQNISLQTESLDIRKSVQDSLDNMQEKLIQKYIPKEKIEEFQNSLIEEKNKDLDSFIKNYGLDSREEASTSVEKDNIANSYIQYKTLEFVESELNKIPVLSDNINLGLDTVLLSSPNELLQEYSEILSNIINTNSVVDKEIVDKLKKIYDKFNVFDLNTYSELILEKAKEALTNNETLSFDSFKVPSLSEKYPDVRDFMEDANISLNPDGTYHLTSGDDYELDLELSDLDLKAIINDIYSGAVGDSSKLIGGLYSSGEYKGMEDKLSFNKLIKRTLEESLASNPNIPILGNASEALSKIKEKSIVESPLRKLMESISKELTGENVFNILNEEEKVFQSLPSLSDYTLTNKLTEGQLRAALAVITMTKAILNYSTGESKDSEFGSMIDIVNNFRKKSGLPEIPTIDNYAHNIIFKDLRNIESTISFLLELSAGNTVSKLKESSLSLARNELNLLYLFSSTANNISLFNGEVVIDGNPFFDFDFSDKEMYFKKIVENGFKDAENPEVLEEIDSVFTNMQEYYYNKFNNLSPEGKEEFITILSTTKKEGKIGLDHFNNFDTKINRNSSIDDYASDFISNFIMSTVAINQKQLKGSFLKVLENTSSYAPFFGQYLSISMAMAMELNPDLINKYIAKKHELNPELTGIMFQNITLVNGDPGSGKTTSVAYFIKQLLKEFNPDAKIIAAAPNLDQAEKLAKLLDEPKGLSKKDLFNEVLTEEGKNFYEDVIKDLKESSGSKYGNSLKLNPVKDFDKLVQEYKEPVYLFIDEYTHFSSYEMDILSKIPNLRILGLGDIKQEGFKLNGVPNEISGIVFTTPTLMMSVRAANGHKQDNLSILSTILRKSLEDINKSRVERSSLNLSDRHKLLSESTYLKYYEDSEKLQGDKVVNSVSESYIRNLINTLGDKEKITLITDKPDSELITMFTKLIEEFPDKVNIRKSNEVQGSEYKYVVVDVKYDIVRGANDSTFNDTFLNSLRAFYTHITRSSEGSIIISANNNVPVAGSLKMDFSSNSELQQSDIDKYKTIISKVFEKSAGSSSKEEKSSGSTSESAAPESSSSEKPIKNVTEIAKQLKEREDAILEEDKKHQDENLPVYFDAKHVGLAISGDQFIPSSNNEDLSGVITSPISKSDLINSNEYKAWSLIRHYCYYPNKDKFKRNIRSGAKSIEMFKSFSKLLTGDENNLTGLLDIITKGKLLLKVSKYNPNVDHQLDNLNLKRKSKNFARIVFQLTGADGSKYDITVANIAETDNIQFESLREVLNKDYAAPKYFDVNFDKLALRNFGSDESKKEEKNEYGIPLSELQKIHPELTISEVYYEKDGVNRGHAYVLVTDSLMESESELLNSYGVNSFEIIKKEVSEVPYTYKEYFDTLDALMKNRHNSKIDYFKLRKFVPYAFSSRLIASVYRLQYLLDNEEELKKYNSEIEEYNKKAQEYNEAAQKVGGLRRKILRTPISNDAETKRALRIIIDNLSEFMPVNSSDAVVKSASLKEYEKQIKTKRLTNFDKYLNEISVPTFNKQELQFLNRFKDRRLESLFKELSNVDSPLYKNSPLISADANKSGEQILAEKSQQMYEALLKLSDTFSGKTLESVSELFDSNILFYSIKDLKLVEYFSKLEGDQKNILMTSLEASGLFPDGIISRGRDAEAGYIEGYIKALANKDRVYMYNRISPRKAYIPYSSINIKENNAEGFRDINTILKDNLDKLKSKVDPVLSSKFDKIMNKFSITPSWSETELIENLNIYINNNYQRIKELVWDTPPKLVSLQWKNGELNSVYTDLTRNSLENYSLNPEILSSIADSNLKFSKENEIIQIKSENGGFAIEIKLDDDGNIRLAEVISTSDSSSNSIIINKMQVEELLTTFKLAITEDLSDLTNKINSKSNLSDKVSLLSEYIEKKGIKVNKRMKNRIEKLFSQDNNSNC